MKKLKLSDFIHGAYVDFKVRDKEYKGGRICHTEDGIWICHPDIRGNKAPELFGMSYSRRIYKTGSVNYEKEDVESAMSYNNFSDIRIYRSILREEKRIKI
jgi:hypothetical protein